MSNNKPKNARAALEQGKNLGIFYNNKEQQRAFMRLSIQHYIQESIQYFRGKITEFPQVGRQLNDYFDLIELHISENLPIRELKPIVQEMEDFIIENHDKNAFEFKVAIELGIQQVRNLIHLFCNPAMKIPFEEYCSFDDKRLDQVFGGPKAVLHKLKEILHQEVLINPAPSQTANPETQKAPATARKKSEQEVKPEIAYSHHEYTPPQIKPEILLPIEERAPEQKAEKTLSAAHFSTAVSSRKERPSTTKAKELEETIRTLQKQLQEKESNFALLQELNEKKIASIRKEKKKELERLQIEKEEALELLRAENEEDIELIRKEKEEELAFLQAKNNASLSTKDFLSFKAPHPSLLRQYHPDLWGQKMLSLLIPPLILLDNFEQELTLKLLESRGKEPVYTDTLDASPQRTINNSLQRIQTLLNSHFAIEVLDDKGLLLISLGESSTNTSVNHECLDFYAKQTDSLLSEESDQFEYPEKSPHFLALQKQCRKLKSKNILYAIIYQLLSTNSDMPLSPSRIPELEHKSTTQKTKIKEELSKILNYWGYTIKCKSGKLNGGWYIEEKD